MILLMSGLIHNIQKSPEIWQKHACLRDLFGMNSFEREDWSTKNKQEAMQVVYKNESAISVVSNLIQIFEIWPQYLRYFTLMNCMKVIDNFFVQDQKNQMGLENQLGPVLYDNQIPQSLIDTSSKFKNVLRELYA